MSWDVSLWHLPFADRIDLSAVPLACPPDRGHVLCLRQGMPAERGAQLLWASKGPWSVGQDLTMGWAIAQAAVESGRSYLGRDSVMPIAGDLG